MAAIRAPSCLYHLGRSVFVTAPFSRPHSSILSRLKPSQVKSCSRTLSIQPSTQCSSPAVCTSRVNGVIISVQRVMYSNSTTSTSPVPKKSQSYMERIKLIMKEYGSVGVIFHTVISLFSIGTCYYLVSRYSTSSTDSATPYFIDSLCVIIMQWS